MRLMSFQEQEQYIPKVAIYKYYLNAINFYGFYLNIIYTSTYNATRNATQCTIWYIQNLICRRNKTHFGRCVLPHITIIYQLQMYMLNYTNSNATTTVTPRSAANDAKLPVADDVSFGLHES